MSTPKQNPDFIKNWLAGLDDEGLKEIQDGLRDEISKRNQSIQNNLMDQAGKYVGLFILDQSKNRIIRVIAPCEQNELAMQCLWFCAGKRNYFGSDKEFSGIDIRGENIFLFSESDGFLSLKDNLREISEEEAKQAFGEGVERAWKEFFAQSE